MKVNIPEMSQGDINATVLPKCSSELLNQQVQNHTSVPDDPAPPNIQLSSPLPCQACLMDSWATDQNLWGDRKANEHIQLISLHYESTVSILGFQLSYI